MSEVVVLILMYTLAPMVSTVPWITAISIEFVSFAHCKQINFKYKEFVGLISLIALNENGYKKLIEISSKSYLKSEDDNEAVCKIEDLFEKKDFKKPIPMVSNINVNHLWEIRPKKKK